MSPIVVTIDGYHRGRQLRPPAFDLFEQLLAVHPVMLMSSAMTEMGQNRSLAPMTLWVRVDALPALRLQQPSRVAPARAILQAPGA